MVMSTPLSKNLDKHWKYVLFWMEMYHKAETDPSMTEEERANTKSNSEMFAYLATQDVEATIKSDQRRIANRLAKEILAIKAEFEAKQKELCDIFFDRDTFSDSERFETSSPAREALKIRIEKSRW